MQRQSRGSSRIMGSESWTLSWLGLGLGSSRLLSLGADGLPLRVGRQLLTCAQVGRSTAHRGNNTVTHTPDSLLTVGFTGIWQLTTEDCFSAEAQIYSMKICRFISGKPQKYNFFISCCCLREIYNFYVFITSFVWRFFDRVDVLLTSEGSYRNNIFH